MEKKSFRDYQTAPDAVIEHYRKLRANQTVDYVREMKEKYCSQFTTPANIWDLFGLLKGFIDVSDPDINLPNLDHLFQTAEAIRRDNHPDWLQLVGLIHDLGKILYLKDDIGLSVEEQWGIVGDTFITGCRIPDSCEYPEFNSLNPDMADARYNTELGVYQEGCGLDTCLCSFGHDEYLYHLLKNNNTKLPDEALYIIRYHSLYPWHRYGAYVQLMDARDEAGLKWVQLFNKYDLYSKVDKKIDYDALHAYYDGLIQKYIGSTLKI